MPRLVKIPECAYEVYAKIRGAILDHAPWALRNDIYEKETKTAFFFFEDSDYISFRLQPFIINPPFDKQRMNAALANVDAELELIQQSLGWVKTPFSLIPGSLIEKWSKALKTAQHEGDDNVIHTIHEFLADLGVEESKQYLADLMGSGITHSELIAIANVESDEEYEQSIKDLPEEIKAKLREWRAKKKEEKKADAEN